MKGYGIAALLAFVVLLVVATVAQLVWSTVEAFTGMAAVKDLGATICANALWSLAWVGVFVPVAWSARHWGGAHAFGQWPVVAVAVAGAAVAWWRLLDGSGASFGWAAAEAVLVTLGFLVFDRGLPTR